MIHVYQEFCSNVCQKKMKWIEVSKKGRGCFLRLLMSWWPVPSVTIRNLAPAAGPRLDRDKLPITLLLPLTCSSPQMQDMIIMTITITRTVIKTYNLPSHQKFHFLMEVSISSGFIILSHHPVSGHRQQAGQLVSLSPYHYNNFDIGKVWGREK